MPRKKKRGYGDYTEIINGDLYASVNIRLGNGKYKKKRKKVSNKTEALKWALEQLDSRHETLESKSFSEVARWYQDKFLTEPVYQKDKKVLGIRTYKTQQRMLNRLCGRFGSYRRITLDDLLEYKKERLRTVSISTINREFSLLKTIFKKAQRRGWIKNNPFDSGESLIEVSLESQRVSPLTERIAKRLLARSRKSEQPLLHYLILVLKNTGARPSEVMPYEAYEAMPREPLIWKNILDFDFRAVKLVSYKERVRKERIVPASLELEQGLRRFYREINPQPEDMLFPIKNVKRSWKTLCKSVGCEGVWIRDFRKYFNNRLINLRFDEVSRMLLLGHSKIETNLRYSTVDNTFIENFRKIVDAPEIETVQ